GKHRHTGALGGFRHRGSRPVPQARHPRPAGPPAGKDLTMATRIWPTDGADGSVATEFRWRAMARTWRMSGILPEEPLTNWGEFQAVFTPPNVLNVNPGAAWVDGHFVINEDILELPITDPGLAVLHVDPATNSAAVIWKAGGGASAIQDP